MRTWIKRSLIGVFSAAVLVGGLAACSHQRAGHAGWSMSEADTAKLRERLVERASRKLQLDEPQKARLNTLADALQAQRDALRGGQPPRTELQALVAGAQFDRTRAQALIEAKTVAVREKSPAVVAAFGDFYDSLRADQQQTLREALARGRGRHGAARD